jgi:hypothetical protein
MGYRCANEENKTAGLLLKPEYVFTVLFLYTLATLHASRVVVLIQEPYGGSVRGRIWFALQGAHWCSIPNINPITAGFG